MDRRPQLAVVIAAVAALGSAGTPTAQGANCADTSTGLTPLSDLTKGSYHGQPGGLYPSRSNHPSSRYRKKGLAQARRVTRLGPDGRPRGSGRVVLLSLGMSNALQEFAAFKRDSDSDASRTPAVTVVNGAQGGQDAERIKSAGAPYWTYVDRQLQAAGVTARQVQAAWLKEAIAGERQVFPADARQLQADLRAIINVARRRFPNLRLVYLASRTYAGYATTRLNPEPFAYQSGFAVRWTIEDRIRGRLRGPWVGWGPYLWADGLRGRRDGLVWTCGDVQSDGTHPSASGRAKVAGLLRSFFRTDATARPWYRRR